MCHEILRDARLYAVLLKYDEDLAAQAQAAGCECGGVLHVSDFPRKPRGGPSELGSEHDRRLSFCCDRDGCRSRVTPPSVRFLGRRVYLGAVVVLVSAMRNGPTPRRVAKLVMLIGASRRTLQRWRAWWRTVFAESAFWKAAAGRLAVPVARRFLPQSLLERFAGDERERLVATLRFLAPITSESARKTMAW